MAEFGTFGSNSTAVTRQRTFTGPIDEETATLDVNLSEKSRPDPLSLNAEERYERRGIVPSREGLERFWTRFTRKGKKNIGVVQSFRAIVFSSWLNLFVIFIPLAWVAHFQKDWPHSLTFTLCFLALVPLEWLFDWGGEQMAFYCGKHLGDLIVVTLNNIVEATLSIILLTKCELKLLQSTIVGVVILHLLLIPGTAFITGGAMILHQDLHPHLVQLNHSLLTIGVMSLLLPAAFFAALDRGSGITLTPEVSVGVIVNDHTRHIFLTMSRGLAIILLLVYISSRVFLHNPPGEKNLHLNSSAPDALRHEEKHLVAEDPEVNQYILVAVLVVSIAIMAATTEWLVESIEFVRESGHIEEEWFGMFLLPIVSFAANGFVAVVYFTRYVFRHFFKEPSPPTELAKGRAIDLSIQFTLFWMPFLVVLGWWIDKPMSLLFDFFEVAVLLGACFIVNYVTADAKTNWAEGFAMVAFYAMIAVCAWFYTGQPEISILSMCGTVQEALATFASGGAEGAHHE
ncbi:Vacuolar calcium ion transporter [Hypsizygus marmoreus]|uniref:Vacuolar calcium ion transporter n=1 Tax=Hypsizygus marmoreus TaxID=39966 RepID=A0A369JEF2_HYPMA|nr:Vacuolar calcium ion transporter [Hypsizygus marmoreus]